jgi:membrane protein YdbS with pleckstrin-like domain
VIVWDSREAEERNARQSLAERTRDVQRARQRVRLTTVSGITSCVWLVGAAGLLSWLAAPPDWLPIVALVLLTVLAAVVLLLAVAGLWWWPRARRSALAALPVHQARLRVAQQNHDRVFGGQS